MKTLLTLLLLGATMPLFSQDSLTLIEPRLPAYGSFTLPERLYAFQPNTDIEELVDTILRRTGYQRNFTLVAANVSTVMPVIAAEGRYLLYNQVYLNFQVGETDRLALLAQAVGHHVLNHQLTEPRRRSEVLQADAFVGLALFRLGVTETALDDIPVLIGQSNTMLLWEDRLAAIKEGFVRARAYATVQPHAAYSSGTEGNALEGLPEFPFPPPEASATRELTTFFDGFPNLGDVNRHLCFALESHGYYERRYYYVKNGFALVTAVEQFHHPGGESKAEPGRWSARPVRQESFSLSGYLRSLFTADPAYYRVFVFIVTPETWAPDPDRTLTGEVASKWLRGGAITFPEEIGEMPFTSSHKVTALVYEFIKDEGINEMSTSRPSDLDGRTHLLQAGLLEALNRH
ncbi:MAG: hypothetical protein KDC54_04650 [Lewinella sp.]|nr:hypothetical protein [Lewinella sp.]